MKRKYLPLILMLTAGVITCIITCIREYSILAKLTCLLIVLIVFYIIGLSVKNMLDMFERKNEKAEEEKKTAEDKK